MADDQVNRKQFLVRELGTSSVTFFPSSANIVRDVKDVSVKPGPNEITILGVTPTADENSIKVDGKGSATITDMMVELIPNPDRYEDVYPSDSESEESSSDSSSDSDSEEEAIQSLRWKEEKIIRQMKVVQEKNNSAAAALKILEGYGKTVEKNRPDDISELLSSYQEQREKQFAAFHASENENAKLLKDRLKAGKNLKEALEKAAKSKSKERQAEQKKKDVKLREKKKLRKAKREEKAMRLQFWPKKVYKITVSLDCISDFTPASSRRGSVTSFDKSYGKDLEASSITLSVSYITNQASWMPRYDLNLATPTSSGSIMYRAEFKNATSETWKDAKVTLSTSETTFQGLGDPIPQMQPWHIDLTRSGFGRVGGGGALCSKHEYEYRSIHLPGGGFQRAEPAREALFGSDEADNEMQELLAEQNRKRMNLIKRENQIFANSSWQNKSAMHAPQQQSANLFQSSQKLGQPSSFGGNNVASRGLFGSSSASNRGGGLFGSNSSNNAPLARSSAFGSASAPPPPTGANAFGAAPASAGEGVAFADKERRIDEMAYDIEAEVDTLKPEEPSLETLESSMSESGLTVNYDIPGLRTLAPSFTHRRHRIATIQLKDIQLSHVLVPKLRTAAFLKARVKNTSNYALLRGPVGVTLDGSFLGNTALPRASAGETMSMSLGVDPSVLVTYSRTTMRKTQTGILNKESSSTYTRTCTVTNTKANRIIEGLVIDQVPISNEERLKVDIVQPRGLKKEKDIVKCGYGVTSAGKDDPNWGKATATFKKAAEVAFDFKIQGGKGVKFLVEYETRYPSSEEVINA